MGITLANQFVTGTRSCIDKLAGFSRSIGYCESWLEWLGYQRWKY